MTTYTLQTATHRFRQFYELTKPRVVSLIVFCAVVGVLCYRSDGEFGTAEMLLAAVAALSVVIGLLAPSWLRPVYLVFVVVRWLFARHKRGAKKNAYNRADAEPEELDSSLTLQQMLDLEKESQQSGLVARR